MSVVTSERLLQLARDLADRPLTTVTGREYTVGFYRDRLVFTPVSSGIRQSDGREAAERFVARSNETGSLRPGDYADVSRNASYLVGMLLADGRGGA